MGKKKDGRHKNYYCNESINTENDAFLVATSLDEALLKEAIETIRKDIDYYKRKQEKVDSGYYKVRSDEPAFFVDKKKDGEE